MKTIDGATHYVGAIGMSTINTGSREINLYKFLYVLALKQNLILVGSLIDKHHTIIFTNFHCLILNDKDD